MSLGKRFLESPFALAVTGVLLRVVRWICIGGTLPKADPRLHALLRTKEPVLFVCWHQDFLWTIGWLSRWNPRRRSYVLASASRDGGLAAAAAEAVGFREAVRGSSAARGASALLRLQRFGRDPRRPSLAIVADGPRPPARQLKPGPVHLARETGLPLWLLRTSWWPDPSLRRTWARFHAPPPWGRGIIAADGPIHVPGDLDREGLEATRLAIEARLNALAERGDAIARRVWGPG